MAKKDVKQLIFHTFVAISHVAVILGFAVLGAVMYYQTVIALDNTGLPNWSTAIFKVSCIMAIVYGLFRLLVAFDIDFISKPKKKKGK